MGWQQNLKKKKIKREHGQTWWLSFQHSTYNLSIIVILTIKLWSFFVRTDEDLEQ